MRFIILEIITNNISYERNRQERRKRQLNFAPPLQSNHHQGTIILSVFITSFLQKYLNNPLKTDR